MKPITYSLQFRGQVEELGSGLRKHGRAPGCALVTSLTPEGPDARYVWSPDEDEALLDSTLEFSDDALFDERGTIQFAGGHALLLRGHGGLATSVDRDLRHGIVVSDVVGGEGRFAGATGRITSNFLLSNTGDLTENQLGVIFGAR